MCTIISSDMAIGLVGRRNRRQKGIQILSGSRLETKKRQPTTPGGIVEARLQPCCAEVCSTGVVPFPGSRNRYERDCKCSDVSYRSRAAIRDLIGPAGSRLQETYQRIAAAGTATLGDIGLLRAVVDDVDWIQCGVG